MSRRPLFQKGLSVALILSNSSIPSNSRTGVGLNKAVLSVRFSPPACRINSISVFRHNCMEVFVYIQDNNERAALAISCFASLTPFNFSIIFSGDIDDFSRSMIFSASTEFITNGFKVS